MKTASYSENDQVEKKIRKWAKMEKRRGGGWEGRKDREHVDIG